MPGFGQFLILGQSFALRLIICHGQYGTFICSFSLRQSTGLQLLQVGNLIGVHRAFVYVSSCNSLRSPNLKLRLGNVSPWGGGVR